MLRSWGKELLRNSLIKLKEKRNKIRFFAILSGMAGKEEKNDKIQ